MFNRFTALFALLPLVAIGVSAQGLDTKASKDDWEEINFEFNSSVLVDGYPSLLRVAELLQKHPGYKVRVEGHTDIIGNGPYNEKLGQARADTVRDFLVKYGASAGQITTGTRGKVDPKYPGQKPVYTKTDEARWMNRRVVLTVMDESGKVIGAGGPGEAIRAMEPAKGMTDCCTEVLKRLDKLDDIARLLKDLADQNAQLRKELDDLKNSQAVLQSKVNQPPPAPAPAPAAPSAKSKEGEKFQLLGINVGADQDGHVSASCSILRTLAPMSARSIVQYGPDSTRVKSSTVSPAKGGGEAGAELRRGGRSGGRVIIVGWASSSTREAPD